MPEFIRSIANRMREFVGNRRRAPRYQTRLEVEIALSVAQPGMKKGAERAGQTLRLSGYTRDISATGLALVLPTIHIGGNYITAEKRTLQITLKLATGPIEIYGTPVRYSPLDEDATDRGYLVGVAIDRMSADHQTRFNAHIEGMRE